MNSQRCKERQSDKIMRGGIMRISTGLEVHKSLRLAAFYWFKQQSLFSFSSRVVAQNERRDEWTSLLITIKKLFIQYPVLVRLKVAGAYSNAIQMHSTPSQAQYIPLVDFVFKCSGHSHMRCYMHTIHTDSVRGHPWSLLMMITD